MRPLAELLDETRRSWDVATAAHDAHKVDQGRWLRDHGTLFPEEIELLGPVAGRSVLHLCCNGGQDSISLARRLGARVIGVDFSGQAIATARRLALEAEAEVVFVESEVGIYLEGEHAPVEVVFGSYGFLPWMLDLPRFFRGVARALAPGGRFVTVDFHPLAWSFDEDFRLKDPYFAPPAEQLFSAPVSDYVGASDGALSPSGHRPLDAPYHNPHPAHAAQHTTAEQVTAILEAGLVLEALREWPYANGCRIHRGLVHRGDAGWDARRFTTPPGVPSLPLMIGLVARKPFQKG